MSMMIGGQPARWDTLRDLIQDRAASNGDVVALSIAGESKSYRELDALANQMAAGLARLGIEKGDRVSSFAFNSMALAIGLFACAKIGAIWAPLNAGLVSDELERTLHDASPKVLLVDPELAERLATVSEDIRRTIKIFLIGAADNHVRSYLELLESEAVVPSVELSAIDAAVIIYTGGTTGVPKGAVLSHFACLCAGYRYVEGFGIVAGDRHLSVLMMFHVGGLFLGLLGPMVGNIPTTLLRWFSASSYWADVKSTKATVVDLIGTMISVLCKAPRSPDDSQHNVRVCLGAVGQVAPEVTDEFEARFHIRLARLFSQTESGGSFTVYNPPGSGKKLSVGKGWGWAEAMVVDEFDQPCPVGTQGEIVLRQKIPYSFMTRYFNNDAATVVTMRNGLLHTGDIGYLDEEGWLYFVGRQAHWIRRRGENISAFEIESVLARYPGVREIAAVGVPSELGEEDVKAVIATEAGADIDPEALIRWCEDKLAAFKIPRYLHFTEELPRSTTKREILRHVLREWPNDSAWDSDVVFGRRGARRPRAPHKPP